MENRPKCIAVHGGLCETGGIEKEFTDVLSPTGWTGTRIALLLVDVWDQILLFVQFFLSGWSGFSDTFTEYHLRQIQTKIHNENWKTETYKVKCHTLKELMTTVGQKYATNSEINYLSIDTEGSERVLIDSIDFQQLSIKGVVQVEANLAEVLQLGDENAVENVQAVRDRLKNFNFIGPLTARVSCGFFPCIESKAKMCPDFFLISLCLLFFNTNCTCISVW